MSYRSKVAGVPPAIAAACIRKQSVYDATGKQEVAGYDFNNGIDHHKLLQTYLTSGFSATNFGLAVEEVKKMIDCKLSVPITESNDYDRETGRRYSNCTIFLGFTSNLISSGVRDNLRYLCQHNMVDCVVTSAGGIEEDFIKCIAPTYVGAFHLDGVTLRRSGVNRIGNLLVPNENYCKFEDWIMPILNTMLDEQNTQGINWTPSKVIHRLGKEINDESSVYYWCYKNNIPVFSPALTDGSIGDMLYFQSYTKPGFKLDLVEDVRRIDDMAVYSKKSGMIILGGGLCKHHICNAHTMREGADFSLNINTAQEFDGCDSGARPDEAKSWGKIKAVAEPVKLYTDATLAFPLIVAETFAQRQKEFDDRLVEATRTAPPS